MITAVDFISLSAFSSLLPAPDMAVISIGDPAQSPPENLSAFAHSLRLEFLDVEQAEADHYGIPDDALFSSAQATEVSDFVRELHEAEHPCRLVVHCRLGSSRSAAVALVVHELTGCAFPRRPDAHFANRHVVNLLSRMASISIEVPSKREKGEPHPYLGPQLQI